MTFHIFSSLQLMLRFHELLICPIVYWLSNKFPPPWGGDSPTVSKVVATNWGWARSGAQPSGKLGKSKRKMDNTPKPLASFGPPKNPPLLAPWIQHDKRKKNLHLDDIALTSFPSMVAIVPTPYSFVIQPQYVLVKESARSSNYIILVYYGQCIHCQYIGEWSNWQPNVGVCIWICENKLRACKIWLWWIEVNLNFIGVANTYKCLIDFQYLISGIFIPCWPWSHH